MNIIEYYNKNYKFRFVQEKDIDELFEIYSNYEIIKYTDNRLHQNREDTVALYSSIKKGQETGNKIYWLVRNNKDKLVGAVWLSGIDRFHKFAALGCLLKPEFQGKGIAQLLIKAVLHHAFSYLKLHRIEAQVYENHHKSIKLFERMKFKKEAILRENFLIEEKYRNSIMFSMLKNEFCKD